MTPEIVALGAAIRRACEESRLAQKFADVTIEQLVDMWACDIMPEEDLEDIHAELNRRGHGDVCAV